MFEEFIGPGILAIIAFVLIFVIIIPGIKIVRDDEVGIVTRKWTGEKLPRGQIIATKGEIGVQAETLRPGLYYYFPFFWKVEKAGLIQIPTGQIGIVAAVDGKQI